MIVDVLQRTDLRVASETASKVPAVWSCHLSAVDDMLSINSTLLKRIVDVVDISIRHYTSKKSSSSSTNSCKNVKNDVAGNPTTLW